MLTLFFILSPIRTGDLLSPNMYPRVLVNERLGPRLQRFVYNRHPISHLNGGEPHET